MAYSGPKRPRHFRARPRNRRGFFYVRSDQMPAGRPSTYSEAYCNEAIECLAEGKSVAAFAGRIGVARSSVYKWAEEHPEFSDAIKIGQAKATEFWEDILIKIAREGGGNATAAIFGLKNRAPDDWREKAAVSLENPDGSPMAPTDPYATAKAVLAVLTAAKIEEAPDG